MDRHGAKWYSGSARTHAACIVHFAPRDFASPRCRHFAKRSVALHWKDASGNELDFAGHSTGDAWVFEHSEASMLEPVVWGLDEDDARVDRLAGGDVVKGMPSPRPAPQATSRGDKATKPAKAKKDAAPASSIQAPVISGANGSIKPAANGCCKVEAANGNGTHQPAPSMFTVMRPSELNNCSLVEPPVKPPALVYDTDQMAN
eukprot:2381426-Prymnesium_polylepis.1